MKQNAAKLMSAFVVLMIFSAATATASAQTRSIPSFIYGIDSDGALKVYRHNGASIGAGLETAGAWEGPNNVGSGWNDYKTVFAGGPGIIYAIKADGTLEWRQHQGLRSGSDQWGETRIVGRGWGDFAQVFPGGDGIIYAITQDGKLRWYKHNAYLTGAGLETPSAWEGPKEVGTGWNGFRQVLPAGAGVILVIENNGKLRWYRHTGYLTGLGTPGAWEGPKEVGHGWGFKQVFSSGGGIIYAITQAGELLWYKHNGYLTGASLETPGAWEGKKMVGRGWGDFVQVFALLQGPSLIDQRRRTSDSDEDLGSRGGPLETKRDPGRAGTAFQPENTIKVSVRYKKEFGYLGDTNAFGNVGPTSCNAFSVSVVVGDGSAGQRIPLRISGDSKMEEIAGYYFCNYLVSDVPLNQPVRVSVGLSGFDQSAPWKGGSLTQPAPGQQRTIIIVSGRDGAPMTLTATQPRARQLFEMVYTSQPR